MRAHRAAVFLFLVFVFYFLTERRVRTIQSKHTIYAYFVNNLSNVCSSICSTPSFSALTNLEAPTFSPTTR